MSDIREVINPHDKITIDCTDMDAARAAVLAVGMGKYGISDGGLPIFILGGGEEYFQKNYRKSVQEFFDSVSLERLATALESMQMTDGLEPTSLLQPVAIAHGMASQIRKNLAEAKP